MPGQTAAVTGHIGYVIYQVWVNGIPYPNVPAILDCELWLANGQHDMFFLRIELPRGTLGSSVNIWPNDTPIQIQWGRSPDLNMWYGYVNHNEIQGTSDSGTKAQQLLYVCIGTSSVLNADASRNWTQVSPTYIAKQIAQENNFRAVVSPISWVLDYEAQANESDFAFLNKIANKTGMRFWCSGGTIYMVQPNIQLVGNQAVAPPVFYCNKSLAQQDTVRDFKQLSGNNIPGSVVANRAIFGIDSTTGQPFSAVNQPITGSTSRVVIKTDAPVNSYYDAKNRIAASAALSQFSIQASAQLFGDTTIYPGTVVNLQGLALPNGMSGDWLITSACHRLRTQYLASVSKDVYVVDVNMVRNIPGGLSLVTVPPVIPEFATCTLTNGLWSCYQADVIVETPQ